MLLILVNFKRIIYWEKVQVILGDNLNFLKKLMSFFE